MPTDPTQIADQEYAARKQRENDLASVNAYLAIHPEAATSAPAGPAQAGTASQPASAGAQPSAEGLQPSGEYTGKDILGNPYTLSKRQVGESTTGTLTGLDEATRQMHPDLARLYDTLPLIGAALGITKVVSGGLAARAAETAAGGAEAGAAGAEAGAATTAAKPQMILDASGQPITPVGEAGAAVGAKPGAAGAGEGTPAQLPPEHATPEAAAQTLADKQIEALKTAKVGKGVAEEFGRPDIATTQSEEETLAQSEAFKGEMESFYKQPVTAPDMSARTAALAKVFHAESNDLHDVATDLLSRSNAGEDVTAETQALNNRFSAYAVQYAKLAGARSDAGRLLQHLDPLKPENIRATETAKLAQQLGDGNNPRDLVEMLARLTPDQLPRAAGQVAERSGMGASLYNALHEFYIDNLLSDAGRTSGRIGLSNSISGLMQLPSRQIAAAIPGSPVRAGEPLAMLEGVSNGFWHALDVGYESLKTGDRVAMMEDAPEASPFISKPAISAQAFGLEDTTLGKAIDYVGNVMRLPQRGLTAVHQFGWSIAKSMELHGLAWRQAVSQAEEEGLSGMEGYSRATEVYKGMIADGFTPELRAMASKAADVTTFANAIEGKYPEALQTLAHAPGMNLVLPFFRVAYNVKKMGLDYTPGIGMLTQAGEILGGDSAARNIALGKQALAGLIAGLAAHEAIKGNLTGDGPPPGAARDALMAQGWRPNSYKIGSTYVKLPEPLAFPLSVVANTVELGNHLDAPTYAQRAAMVVQALSRAFANDSLVQGLVNLKQAANDAEEQGFGPAMEKFLGKTAQGFVPFSGALGAIQRAENATTRNPRTMSEQIKTILPDLPGGYASQYTAGSVSPRYDMFGEPVVGMPGVPNNLLYPVNLTHEKLDPVREEIARLQPSVARIPQVISGRAQHALDDPNNPDIGVPLTPAEQDQWAKDRGEGMHDQMASLMESPAYKSSSDGMKKQMVEYIAAKHAQIANAKLLQNPDVMARYAARQEARARAMVQTPTDEFGSAPPEETSSSSAVPELR